MLNQEIFANWEELNPETPVLAVNYNFANYKEFWIKITILKKIVSSESYIIKLSDATQEMVNNRDIWVFHNVISHKLRTPFNHILGGLSLLKQNMTDLTENQEKILNIALNGAQRYFGNITNILDLISNLNNKTLKGFTPVGKLREIIEAVFKEMKVENFKIESSIIKDDLKLNLPHDILELVLYKIFDNSKKFHPTNDPSIETKISKNKDDIKISISDDGVKLSAEDHLKIWTPYYQAEELSTGEIEGSGLGLAFIAQLMLKSKGKCRSFNNDNGITVELCVSTSIE